MSSGALPVRIVPSFSFGDEMFVPVRSTEVLTAVPGSNLHFDRHDAPEEILQKIIYHCARINIREVWVANRRVHALETSRIRH